jgi:LysR family transcriptional regulator of abg operon
LAELCDEEWVKQALIERSSEMDISRPFETRGLPAPKVVLQTSSAVTTLHAVASTNLLAVVPRLMLRDPIATDLFDIVDIDEALEGAPMCMVRRVNMPLTPLAEHLADIVKRAAMNLPMNG